MYLPHFCRMLKKVSQQCLGFRASIWGISKAPIYFNYLILKRLYPVVRCDLNLAQILMIQ